MTTAFCSYVSDEYYHSFGADKLVASAKYFYPEIPFFVFGTKEIEGYGLPVESLHPNMIGKLINDYECVVYFDADSIIVGPLDELFEEISNYDVVCVRNNNDFGKAGKDEALSQQNRNIDIYVNAGLVATKSKRFVRDWIENNRLYAELVPFGSQSVLNTIIDRYKWSLVDHKDKPVYYGVSSLHGEQSHWESWKKIEVVGADLFLNDKKVKVLHHAGGFMPHKLGLYMFSDETRERIIQIIYPQ